MTKRMPQDRSEREPELAEILDLGNFQEAIELLVEKPLRSLSDDQRSHTEALFEAFATSLAESETRVATWMTEAHGRLGSLQVLLESERSAGSQHEVTCRQEAAALTSAVARIQLDIDQLREQQRHLVSFAQTDAQEARAVAHRDRVWSRLMVACVGVLLMVLLVVEFVRS